MKAFTRLAEYVESVAAIAGHSKDLTSRRNVLVQEVDQLHARASEAKTAAEIVRARCAEEISKTKDEAVTQVDSIRTATEATIEALADRRRNAELDMAKTESRIGARLIELEKQEADLVRKIKTAEDRIATLKAAL